MTKQQEAILPELFQNFIMSSQMEGLDVSDTVKAMCLSVLNGERSKSGCYRCLQNVIRVPKELLVKK